MFALGAVHIRIFLAKLYDIVIRLTQGQCRQGGKSFRNDGKT